jgi:hypothetical protein
MHYDEGRLLAYADGEASPEERDEIAAHVQECGDCAATLARVESDREFATQALRRLEPAAEVIPLPVQVETAPREPVRRFRWSAVAAAAAIVLVLSAMAFTPVRSMAAGLLKVFRVQNVQTIDLSQADMQNISAALKSGEGHIDLKSMGEVWIDGAGSQPKQVTLGEAQAAVDFPVKLPSGMPAEPKISLQQAQTYRFKLNVAAINKALKYYGSDQTLPSSIDGKVFSVEVPAIVLAEYTDPTLTSSNPDIPQQIAVGQARSPELVVPDGVNAAELRSVLLSLPFIPQSVRDQLAAMTDWESTLVIPNVGGSSRSISLDGVRAVVVRPEGPFVEGRNGGELPATTTVIWNDNGVVRGVGGPINEETAINLAKSTMK